MHCNLRRGAEAQRKTFTTKAIFTGMKGMHLYSRRGAETLSKTFKEKALFTGMKGMNGMESGAIWLWKHCSIA
jgi:hypothetical protein